MPNIGYDETMGAIGNFQYFIERDHSGTLPEHAEILASVTVNVVGPVLFIFLAHK